MNKTLAGKRAKTNSVHESRAHRRRRNMIGKLFFILGCSMMLAATCVLVVSLVNLVSAMYGQPWIQRSGYGGVMNWLSWNFLAVLALLAGVCTLLVRHSYGKSLVYAAIAVMVLDSAAWAVQSSSSLVEKVVEYLPGITPGNVATNQPGTSFAIPQEADTKASTVPNAALAVSNEVSAETSTTTPAEMTQEPSTVNDAGVDQPIDLTPAMTANNVPTSPGQEIQLPTIAKLEDAVGNAQESGESAPVLDTLLEQPMTSDVVDSSTAATTQTPTQSEPQKTVAVVAPSQKSRPLVISKMDTGAQVTVTPATKDEPIIITATADEPTNIFNAENNANNTDYRLVPVSNQTTDKINQEDSAAPLPTVEVAKAARANSEEVETWLASRRDEFLTIQLLATQTEKMVLDFIAEHQLSNVRYFSKRSWSENSRYKVVYGEYATMEEAESALQTIPAALRSLSPWIRNFASIKKEAGIGMDATLSFRTESQ